MAEKMASGSRTTVRVDLIRTRLDSTQSARVTVLKLCFEVITPNLKSPRKPLAEYAAVPIYHQGRLSAPARNLLSGSSFLLAWTKSFMNLGPVTCALLNRTPAVMSFSFKSSTKAWLGSNPGGGRFKDSPSIFNPLSLTCLQASGRDTIALRTLLRVGGQDAIYLHRRKCLPVQGEGIARCKTSFLLDGARTPLPRWSCRDSCPWRSVCLGRSGRVTRQRAEGLPQGMD